MGSTELICNRTFDADLITSIMLTPEIWDSVSEDGIDSGEYMPEVEADCWLLLESDGKLVGAYMLTPLNSATIEIHAHVLPDFRKEHAKSTAIAVLQWILDKCPTRYVKFNAEIPVIYQNVIHFTKNAGFQEEGINRHSYRKHGVVHDQVMLGITRTEIEAFLNGRN